MFGKHFTQMYQGSMVGKSALFFAVWGYVISHQFPIRRTGEHIVEVNPVLLGFTFSTSPESVIEVLKQMCEPDPASRTKAMEGRKLIPKFGGDFVSGPMTFAVVNGAKFRALRDEEERRIYLADKQYQHRRNLLSTNVNNVNLCQPKQKQKQKQKQKEEEREPAPSVKGFSKPSLEEVSEYGNTIALPEAECRKFTDYYTANGWKVGRTAMKDWKAALRNWQRRWSEGPRNVSKPKVTPDYSKGF